MSESRITTLADLPFHVSGRYPKPELVRRCTPGGYDRYTSREFFDTIRDLALGLAAVGVRPGDRVALLCENRPEWLIADFAILTIGAVTVPVYPTLPPAQTGYILADAGATVVIVSDETQSAKVRASWTELPELRTLVVIDPSSAEDGSAEDRETTLSALRQQGHQRLIHEDGLGREYKESASALGADQLATIIYTSGTTGDPKGVMLTHGALVANLLDVDTMVRITDEDNALSFLPLCHALERTTVYLYLFKGVTVTFAESLDTVGRDMQQVRPTLMTGVPRVYEKLHARVLETVSQASPLRRWLFHWALAVGHASAEGALAGSSPSAYTRLVWPWADQLVLSKIRDRTGGRLRFVVSGGAPLPVTVAEFLFAVGIPVLEGYGLTETAPVLTLNPEDAPRLGTVGKALPRVELDLADDGEVLARGPNLMRGYYGQPDATAKAIVDGWFHTGDIGIIDDDGYLAITDRKKELIVTAGGKNVAPQPIEQKIKQDPLVAEAMLVGDRQPFIAVLIIPDFEALSMALNGVATTDREALVARADAKRLYERIVERVNAELAAYERVRKLALVPAELSVETGELTPTLKIKRRVVADRWGKLIEEIYAG